MLYSEYITKAKSICIMINDSNNIAYLLPDYRYILHLAGMDLSNVTDFPDVTMDVVGENLKLEVEAYNKKRENVRQFIDVLQSFIGTVIVPIAADEQNSIIQTMMDNLKTAVRQQSQSQLQQPEQQQPATENKDENIVQIAKYINFQKKDV